MNRKYLAPGITGLVIGLFLGSTMAYFAPDLGAKLAGGARQGFGGLTGGSKTGTGASSSSAGTEDYIISLDHRCPVFKPGRLSSFTTAQKKEKYAWCENNSGGRSPFWTCYNSGCNGLQGPGRAQQTGELRGFELDQSSGLYLRACGAMKTCNEDAKYNIPGVIGVNVFRDDNRNGKQDFDEPAIPNRQVEFTNNWYSKPRYREVRTTDSRGGITLGPFIPGTNNKAQQPVGSYQVTVQSVIRRKSHH